MSKFSTTSKSKRDNILTLTFLDSLSKEEKNTENKEVNFDSDSKEIAKIISSRLLSTIQKKLVLK